MPSEYILDGAQFSSLDEFYDEIGRILIPGSVWGKNLDAFDDILGGGFGAPDDGFVLQWRNSAMSRQVLGYPETCRQLEQRLERCHPSNRNEVRLALSEARQSRGPTVFDWLVEIIRRRAADGELSGAVTLVLE